MATGRIVERDQEKIDKADGFVRKPIKTKTFLEEIKALIEEHD